SPPWQDRLLTLDAEGLETLLAERNRLVSAGVAARFEQCRQDGTRRAEWERRLGEVLTELAGIPEDARLLVFEAERGERKAQADARRADEARTDAQRVVDDLARKAAAHAKLIGQLRTTERQHQLHKKLDDLLGQDGLQRELVRSAEQD